MYRFLFFFLTFLYLSHTPVQAQTVSNPENDSPYELNWAVDGPYFGASIGLNVLGLKLIKDKDPLSEEYLNSLSKEDVFIVDRWAAGNYSPDADELSYYPFYGSFALPLLFLISENERNHFGQISVMYVESMATAGALFTLSAGLVQRSRPLVYNTDIPLEERIDNDAQRSFFAGHVAATGAATFFFAKVFYDFNPDSWAVPYVWAAAAIIPAWVGYLRIESGKHFLTDSLLGYGVGALSGILIPELHKAENQNFSLTPTFDSHYKGISINYTF